MRDWLDHLVAALLAPLCAACRQPLTHPTRSCVCHTCWNAIVRVAPPLCDCCGDTRCRTSAPYQCDRCLRARPVVERARAVGPHAGSLRAIVHALKYDGRRSVASPLAALMRSAGSDAIAGCDVAVAVPLHRARLRSRGFNQADDLARRLGLRVVPALRRVRDTHTQTTLPAQERHANVAGAFEATRHAARLRGATVLLVDDVRTTGATLDACASALRDAGAASVRALTAARVATPAD